MPSTEHTQIEWTETATGAGLRPSSQPGLSAHLRLTFDRVRERHVLLGPESVLVLNPTGAAILELCDGRRTVTGIVRELERRYDRVVGREVVDFLARLAAKGCVEVGDA
ncbi:pyrroloquinoline quinone biosynthesis protein D [Lipingzhangella halophila]|uniref:Pyrroloquinoline quinone biosynthesis protein D n=1 Tax=Lipingzhangella halophila TaxID=1783352 RepID=A0A7W7W326_9ACTN|nr:pyrroloquinoline quinone biosynthesis peptide chaperone PqqD [Lipingzhangella halophila]MBB4932341.1 pyrroloquinoline quinone biosynthesis protein D [Lipingzhangella halophila]